MNITKENRTDTAQNESKWTAHDTIDIIFKSIVVIAIFVGIIALLSSFMLDAAKLANDTHSYSLAYDNIYEGVIVDKRLVSSNANLLRPSSTEYRIYITSEYTDENAEILSITKYYSVPEETYLSYDIGDYFNSHNYKTGAEIDDV